MKNLPRQTLLAQQTKKIEYNRLPVTGNMLPVLFLPQVSPTTKHKTTAARMINKQFISLKLHLRYFRKEDLVGRRHEWEESLRRDKSSWQRMCFFTCFTSVMSSVTRKNS